jgi:hypothetical protein
VEWDGLGVEPRGRGRIGGGDTGVAGGVWPARVAHRRSWAGWRGGDIVFQTGRPALARYGPARRGPTLCGPMSSSGQAGTTPRMARWATTVPALSCEDATDGGGLVEAGAPRARASRGRRPTLVEAAPRRRTPGAPVPAAEAAQASAARAPAPLAAGGGSDWR